MVQAQRMPELVGRDVFDVGGVRHATAAGAAGEEREPPVPEHDVAVHQFVAAGPPRVGGGNDRAVARVAEHDDVPVVVGGGGVGGGAAVLIPEGRAGLRVPHVHARLQRRDGGGLADI